MVRILSYAAIRSSHSFAGDVADRLEARKGRLRTHDSPKNLTYFRVDAHPRDDLSLLEPHNDCCRLLVIEVAVLEPYGQKGRG